MTAISFWYVAHKKYSIHIFFSSVFKRYPKFLWGLHTVLIHFFQYNFNTNNHSYLTKFRRETKYNYKMKRFKVCVDFVVTNIYDLRFFFSSLSFFLCFAHCCRQNSSLLYGVLCCTFWFLRWTVGCILANARSRAAKMAIGWEHNWHKPRSWISSNAARSSFRQHIDLVQIKSSR